MKPSDQQTLSDRATTHQVKLPVREFPWESRYLSSQCITIQLESYHCALLRKILGETMMAAPSEPLQHADGGRNTSSNFFIDKERYHSHQNKHVNCHSVSESKCSEQKHVTCSKNYNLQIHARRSELLTPSTPCFLQVRSSTINYNCTSRQKS